MSKKKTKINTILAAIVTAGVLITIVLIGLVISQFSRYRYIQLSQ